MSNCLERLGGKFRSIIHVGPNLPEKLLRRGAVQMNTFFRIVTAFLLPTLVVAGDPIVLPPASQTLAEYYQSQRRSEAKPKQEEVSLPPVSPDITKTPQDYQPAKNRWHRQRGQKDEGNSAQINVELANYYRSQQRTKPATSRHPLTLHPADDKDAQTALTEGDQQTRVNPVMTENNTRDADSPVEPYRSQIQRLLDSNPDVMAGQFTSDVTLPPGESPDSDSRKVSQVRHAVEEPGADSLPNSTTFLMPPVPGIPASSQTIAHGEDDADQEAISGQAPDYLKPIGNIQLSSISTIDAGNSTFPENRAREITAAGGTRFAEMGFYSGLSRPSRNNYRICHNPLYFEDPNLERCGHGNGCLTDAVSAIHFAGRIPATPYMMAVRPPSLRLQAKPDCPTGHTFGLDAYIPSPTEIDLGGISVQGAVAVGLIFLIP